MSRSSGRANIADVFISYSQRQPEPTEALARDLGRRGYSVWWDTRLLIGDEFSDVIRKRILEAKAVIVIWTSASVNSKYVKAEAQLADEKNKLLPLRSSDVVPNEIPLPYNAIHTERVDNIDRIVEALESRGIRPHSRDKNKQPAVIHPATEPKLAELIWTPQLQEQYTAWDAVEYGEPVMVKRRPAVIHSENGDVTIVRRGLVLRVRPNRPKVKGPAD
jgi:hypothetical protein